MERYVWFDAASGPAQGIVAETLRYVDEHYSRSGDARNDAIAELYLPYHNGVHSRGVCEDVRLLRDVVGLTSAEYDVALMGGASHDVIYEIGDGGTGQNEQKSANWLAERISELPEYFTTFQRRMAELAILGTGYVKDAFMLRQLATQQDYPSRRAELVAHVVAAADLGRLYAANGPLVGHKYFQEFSTGASGKAPSLDNLLQFQRDQLVFLDGGYEYPSKEIGDALKIHKKEVCDYAASLVVKLETGTIDTWQAVLESDKAFMQVLKAA